MKPISGGKTLYNFLFFLKGQGWGTHSQEVQGI
jgi:hypothetical protein